MKKAKVLLARTILAALILSLAFPSFPVLAQDPNDWQESAIGLSVNQDEEMKTAGLGFIVQAEDWPSLSLQGGVEDAGWGMLVGPVGIELGFVKLPESGSATLSSETMDWAHNEMTFASGAASELKLWVSRLSPALLVQSSSNSLRLLTGNVRGNTFDRSTVSPRPEGPGYPKYVAYMSGGNLQIQTLGTTQIPLSSLDQNWLLLWYGEDSHFVDTKKPLSYTDDGWGRASLPHAEAYQADVPLLLVLENQPTTISHSSEGGVELSFAGQSGYVSLLPLLGRDHPRVSETERWSQGLPGDIMQRVQWWSNHLCVYPVSVNETYAYNDNTDTASITENLSFLDVCSGGTAFAPLPPMLSIAKDALDVTFSGSVVDGSLDTEFGPSLGIENTQSYVWSISGLGKYTDASRIITNIGQPPAELEQELAAEVDKIVAAGHFAPWIFIDGIPRTDTRGDLYWANPADLIYHLAEVAEVLPDPLKADFVDYIEAERMAYPPEDVYDLDLTEGAIRRYYSYLGPDTVWRWIRRPDVHLMDVPLYSSLALSRYYELTGETLSSPAWQEALEALDRDMSEQDWATFYWFKGFEDRMVAVVNANRHFAGLVGFVKLAKMAGDTEAENLGRVLLAKAAVLRLGMAQYPRYLYQANLVELPPEPDWQVRYGAYKHRGYIFNYDWAGPHDDARQVEALNQFEVYLYDHSGVSLIAGARYPYLIAYRDMVPELARFLTDYARRDIEIYMDKVEAIFPHWHAAFAEAGLVGAEHNLSHPINSFQLFMAKAWVQQEDPEKLTTYLDIPWLHEGDLFYLHKLAETIKAYRGIAWDDTVALSGLPGDRVIHLTWRVYTTLPPETTWQIDYDGPAGDQTSPVTGIISSTRAYSLTGLTNYTWYTVTVTAMSGGAPLLTSNTVVVLPTDIFVYLPLVLRTPSS